MIVRRGSLIPRTGRVTDDVVSLDMSVHIIDATVVLCRLLSQLRQSINRPVKLRTVAARQSSGRYIIPDVMRKSSAFRSAAPPVPSV